MPELCNGYCISENLAESVGRKYTVTDVSGDVLLTTDSKRNAMDFAESLCGPVQSAEEPPEETEEESDESEE